MVDYSEDAKLAELLAPVRRLEPVPFAVSERPERHLPVRTAVMAAVVVAIFGLAGAAIADGLGAFDGIGAAQHPRSGADVIDPATRAYMECKRGPRPCMSVIHGLLFDTARIVGQLPGGQNIYVVATTANGSGLCFVVGPPHPEWSCDDPLSRSHPSTVFLYGQDQDITPPTFGIALDGVIAVSFEAHGKHVTVPVKHNVWIYPGDVFFDAYSRLTAHFADGSTVVQTH